MTKWTNCVRDHAPDVLVVGLPLNMDGSSSTETKHARRMGQHLSARYDLPVVYMDERLTTREAIDRSENPNPDHSLAALGHRRSMARGADVGMNTVAEQQAVLYRRCTCET